MAEDKKDEKLSIVPQSEYKPDLEAEVALIVARINAGNPFKVTKKLERIVIPEFKAHERREQLDWELQQIKYCKEGVDVEGIGHVPGRYWFFFQFCQIKHKKKGKIKPDFRATQMHWAMTKDRINATPGAGVVMIKKRQVGMSWDMAADNIYDCIFNNDFDIGMNSKSETDSRNLFLKHKYIHRNLPKFLRAKVSIDRRDKMFFGEWDKKTETHKGTQSSIVSVAPTPTGHAGNQYAKLVIDEAGETELIPIWANAEDCLVDSDGVRIGSVYIFGTVGDVDKVGKDIMEFWDNHKLYGLEQYAFWGYNCSILDELGNDDIENAVRAIIYKRKKLEGASKYLYNKFRQKHPLDSADAFLNASGGGVGDPIILGTQRKYLIDNPPQKVTGWMRPPAMPGGKPDFVPDPFGEVIVYERPDPNRVNGYIAPCDPAEDDDVERSKDNSDISSVILSKPYGLEPPKLCVEMCWRPKKLHEYYAQWAMVLQWYNNTQTHIELNKGGWRMLDWFDLNYPHLVALAPAASNSARGGVVMKKGVKKTTDITRQMGSLGNAYIENYSQFIPSIKMIDQCAVFGAKGKDDDLITAFLWALVILQGDKILARNVAEATSKNPTVNYVKVNGVIQMVTGNTPHPPTEPSRSRSALFRNL